MKLTVRMVLEVLGTPKEHVEKTIKLIIERFKEEEGVKVISAKAYESEKIKAFWSTFCDLEFQVESLEKLINICFNYMPSSLEIVEPAELNIKINMLNNILNDLMSKLHGYDMIIKEINARKQLEALKKQKENK
jgi:hypothetical protein